ncbi:MAG: efflux RND transporter periplasmic adaptor subunit, partial [Phycisphaerae bacterium]|nr:efflux RND transporter periplasmic adaptor subunit [Phycisphaerae bacterium]
SATRVDTPATDRFRGVVSPSQQVALTPPTPGIIREIAVEDGQLVEQDQLLARMEDDVQKAVVEVAELESQGDADIRRQRLVAEEAKLQLDRIEKLEATGAAQEWEVRQTKVSYEVALATLDQTIYQQKIAQKREKLERVRLAHYHLKAPFRGRVLRIATEPGATLSQTDPVLTLVALHELEANIHLPVDLYGKLEVGRAYAMQAADPVAKKLSGRLKVIEPVIDSASQTFRCVFVIDNQDEALPAGFTVRLVWPQEEDSAAAVTAVETAESKDNQK